MNTLLAKAALCILTAFPLLAGEQFFDLGDTLIVRLKNVEDSSTTFRSIIRKDAMTYAVVDSGKSRDSGSLVINDRFLLWEMNDRERMYLQMPLVSGSNWNRSSDSTTFADIYSAEVQSDNPFVWKIRNERHEPWSSSSWPKQFFYVMDYHLFITHSQFRYGVGELVTTQELDSVLKRK